MHVSMFSRRVAVVMKWCEHELAAQVLHVHRVVIEDGGRVGIDVLDAFQHFDDLCFFVARGACIGSPTTRALELLHRDKWKPCHHLQCVNVCVRIHGRRRTGASTHEKLGVPLIDGITKWDSKHLCPAVRVTDMRHTCTSSYALIPTVAVQSVGVNM